MIGYNTPNIYAVYTRESFDLAYYATLKVYGKDSFYPPSLFLSGICFSDVFSDYKTFSSMAFLSEIHNSKIRFFEILKSIG